MRSLGQEEELERSRLGFLVNPQNSSFTSDRCVNLVPRF